MRSKLSFIKKPWGSEEIVEINNNYMLKKLVMLKGFRCSLQYHNRKTETIYVLSGSLKILLGQSKDNLEENLYYTGDSCTIPAGLVHRMEAVEDSIYLEASTPDLDDTVRLDDDYDRVSE